MSKKDAYIWFSGATDVTGKKLAKELKIDGGRDKPKGKKIVIGWGAKTNDDVNFTVGVETLNHPNNIRSNRNKLATLEALKNSNVAVALFVQANKVMNSLDTKGSGIELPLIGRTKYHQGGKGFWTCLTKTHVRDAIDGGVGYFQNYIDIVDEYRLHIFNGKLLFAQKKVKRNNMEEAFVEQQGQKINDYADKAKTKLDKKTLDYALKKIAKDHQKADMIVRSNKRGWKFSHIKQVNPALLNTATASLTAVGMDFGAVDCCIDSNGNPWIIEINSGPGLDGSSLKAYVGAFENTLKSIMSPPKKKEIVVKAAVGKVTGKVGSKSKLGSNSAKERLTGLKELLDLVEDADETECAVIEGLVKKRTLKGV